MCHGFKVHTHTQTHPLWHKAVNALLSEFHPLTVATWSGWVRGWEGTGSTGTDGTFFFFFLLFVFAAARLGCGWQKLFHTLHQSSRSVSFKNSGSKRGERATAGGGFYSLFCFFTDLLNLLENKNTNQKPRQTADYNVSHYFSSKLLCNTSAAALRDQMVQRTRNLLYTKQTWMYLHQVYVTHKCSTLPCISL